MKNFLHALWHVGIFLASETTEEAMMEDVVSGLKVFMENKARLCSMDFGYLTPVYVYRMWGGLVALDEIEAALKLFTPVDRQLF